MSQCAKLLSMRWGDVRSSPSRGDNTSSTGATKMSGNTRPIGYRPPKSNGHVGGQVTFEEITQLHPVVHIRRRKGPPAGETKRDRFRRLGALRMIHALQAIRLLGNLSARAIYEAYPDDIVRIRATLLDAVTDMSKRFNPRTVTEEFAFPAQDKA